MKKVAYFQLDSYGMTTVEWRQKNDIKVTEAAPLYQLRIYNYELSVIRLVLTRRYVH